MKKELADEILTRKEVEEFFKLSPYQRRKWEKNGILKPFLTNPDRFRYSDIVKAHNEIYNKKQDNNELDLEFDKVA